MNPLRLLPLFTALMLASPVFAAETPIDRIVAIADEGIVTERQLNNYINLVKRDLSSSQQRLPSEDVLRRQALEQLINRSLLLQEAARRGIKISDSQLNQIMQRRARDNDMSLSEFRRTLIAQGYNYDEFRETLRTRETISVLASQYGQRYATVSEAEVDEFIKLSDATEANYEYRLSHILLALPDAATPEEIEQAQATAREILQQLDQGVQFDELASQFSAGETALQGGDLGWRRKAEIPSLFTAAVLDMKPGDYAGPIRSASGFHIVHLNEWRDLETTITRQTRSRHILIKTNELISEDEARARLLELRERIEAGEDFDRLARLYSVDYASSSAGGDIGWQNPGDLVREYEEMTSQLEINELSYPVRSQFGWHLIEVTGRRNIDETEENKRNQIQSQLLLQKKREAFELWQRRLRDEAYVVFPGQSDA